MKMMTACVTLKKTGTVTNVGVDARDEAFVAGNIIEATHSQ